MPVQPRQLGRYTLLDPLGEGGQGRVVEAEQHGPGGLVRRVALKLLESDADALFREARLTSLLRHPYLVDVYEVGTVDGVAFCAMELCERSLSGCPPLSSRAARWSCASARCPGARRCRPARS
jgi:serine/threonine protein kinase